MDYLDAMIEAHNKEMALWKIAMFPANVYEISRGCLLVESGPADTSGRPHLEYDNFNRHRNRAAMQAALLAARELENKEIKPLPYKEPDDASKNFISEVILKSSMLANYPGLLTAAKDALTQSKGINEGAAGVNVEPKIDWLALNREASGR